MPEPQPQPSPSDSARPGSRSNGWRLPAPGAGPSHTIPGEVEATRGSQGINLPELRQQIGAGKVPGATETVMGAGATRATFNPNVKLDPSIGTPPPRQNEFWARFDASRLAVNDALKSLGLPGLPNLPHDNYANGSTPQGATQPAEQAPNHYTLGHAMGQALGRELIARRDFMIYQQLKAMGIVE